MSSVHTVVEGGTAASGEPAHLLATNVYAKTPRGWRIVLHHVSIAPGPAPVDPNAQILH
jgi:ketosteroid isomerase-like protein